MKRFSDYYEISVVCHKNGERIGECQELLWNPNTNVLEGIKIKPKAWYKRPFCVRAEAVKVYGDVSIIIDSELDFRYKTATKSPIGQEVIDSFGGLVGYVSDCFFDETSGRVDGIEIRHGLLDDYAYGRTFFQEYSLTDLGEDTAFVIDYHCLKGVSE